MSRIVEWYNAVENSTELCEKDMLAHEKSNIDARLEPLITVMTWDKYDKDYIQESFKLVKDYYERVMKAQENVQKVLDSINAWGETPLFTRKDNQTDTLLDIAPHDSLINSRLRRTLTSNRLAEKVMLDENYRLYFNVPPSCPCSSDSESEEAEEQEAEIDTRQKSRVSQRQQTITEVLGDLNRLRESFSTTLQFEDAKSALYQPYKDYVDKLVGQAVMAAVLTRLNNTNC